MSKSRKRASIADLLKKAIEDSGQKLAMVARGSGVAQPVIHRFVRGERDLTLRTADKLLDYFGIEVRLPGKGEPTRAKAWEEFDSNLETEARAFEDAIVKAMRERRAARRTRKTKG